MHIHCRRASCGGIAIDLVPVYREGKGQVEKQLRRNQLEQVYKCGLERFTVVERWTQLASGYGCLVFQIEFCCPLALVKDL